MLAIAALLISSLIWGATSPIMKWTLASVPLFSLAFIRFFLATIFISPFVIKHAKIKKQDLPEIILAAFLGITLNVSLFFLGLKFTFAVNAALVAATVPIFTLAAANIFLKEKLTNKLIFSAILAVFGLLLILGPPTIALGISHLIGGLLLIVSSLSWVGYEIISKKLFKKYSPKTITFYSFLIGSATFFPIAIFELFKSPGWITNLTLPGLVGILYGAIFASTIAYFCWQYGLSKLTATAASFFFYLDPVTGVIVSVLLLKERITPTFVVGAILVILAVFWAEHKRKAHPLYKKDEENL